MGRIISGKYELLTEVGRGGMSTVYLARDLTLTKNWAVKEVYKKGVLEGQIVSNGLLAEANLMKNLDHPALPRIVDIIEESDRWYIVMDYIEGETLKDILEATGPQKQSQVINWAKELAAILYYLHGQDPPIIYRDMKPANVILQPSGQLKLIDFGIAKKYDAKKREDTLALGTDAFAAPEQFYNSKGILVKADVRTDIYNLGATMYNLLTDMLPTDEPYKFLPIRQINPEFSAGLEKIIIKCIEPDPKDRFQTVEELVKALLNYEKLDENYIYEQKHTLKKAIAPVAIGIIMAAAGAGGLVATGINDANTYEGLLVETGNHQTKVENLEKAIELKPDSAEAYQMLVEEFAQDEDGLTEKESEQILTIYNNNSQSMDKESEEYLDINYSLGENYLIYFTGKSDDSIRNRILTAYPFFNAVVKSGNTDYPKYKISTAYVNLGDFYKNYIVGQGDMFTKDTSEDIYKTLLDDIEDAIKAVDDVNNNQLKIMTYKTCLNLLNNERVGISDAVSKGVTFDVVSKIKKKTAAIRATDASLKRQIEETNALLSDTVKGLETAYENVNKKETK